MSVDLALIEREIGIELQRTLSRQRSHRMGTNAPSECDVNRRRKLLELSSLACSNCSRRQSGISRYYVGKTFTTTALWLGFEISWWTGLSRDKVNLPLSKYDKSSE